MPADGEQSPIHEPGDDDGTRHQAEEVAGGAEEDELERAHWSTIPWVSRPRAAHGSR